MEIRSKQLYIIAGCNGAGKTTAFRKYHRAQFNDPEFVNPDVILKVLIPIINGMQEFLLAGKLFKRLMRILIEASVSAWKQLSRPGRMSR